MDTVLLATCEDRLLIHGRDPEAPGAGFRRAIPTPKGSCIGFEPLIILDPENEKRAKFLAVTQFVKNPHRRSAAVVALDAPPKKCFMTPAKNQPESIQQSQSPIRGPRKDPKWIGNAHNLNNS